MSRNQAKAKTEIVEDIDREWIEERCENVARVLSEDAKKLDDVTQEINKLKLAGTISADVSELLAAIITKLRESSDSAASKLAFVEAELDAIKEQEFFAKNALLPTTPYMRSMLQNVYNGSPNTRVYPLEKLEIPTGKKNLDLTDETKSIRRVVIRGDGFQAEIQPEDVLFNSTPRWQEQELHPFIEKVFGPKGRRVFTSLIVELSDQHARHNGGFVRIDTNNIMKAAGYELGSNGAYNTEDRVNAIKMLDIICSLKLCIFSQSKDKEIEDTIPLFLNLWTRSETTKRSTKIALKNDQGEISGYKDCFVPDRVIRHIQVNDWYLDAFKQIPGRDPQYTPMDKRLAKLPHNREVERCLGIKFLFHFRVNASKVNTGKDYSPLSLQSLLKSASLQASGGNAARNRNRAMEALDYLKKEQLIIGDFRREERPDGPLLDMIYVSPTKELKEKLELIGKRGLALLQGNRGDDKITPLYEDEFFTALVKSKMKNADIAKLFEVSPPTVTKWKNKQAGKEGEAINPSKKILIKARTLLAEWLPSAV